MLTNIQLISNPRSGSTYMFKTLCQYINPGQETAIDAPGTLNEVFCPFQAERMFPEMTLDTVFAKHITRIKHSPTPIVIKHHHWQLLQLQTEFPDLFAEYCELDSYNILLTRQDLFQVSLSAAIADKLREWNTYSNTRVYISPNALHEQILKNVKFNDDIHQNKLGFDYDEAIFYETLDGAPKTDFNALSLSSRVKSDFDVTLTQIEKAPNKSQQVTNYDDLEKYTKSLTGA